MSWLLLLGCGGPAGGGVNTTNVVGQAIVGQAVVGASSEVGHFIIGESEVG